MMRFRAWGLSAFAAAGMAMPAVAADPPPQPTTLASKLFGPAKPKPVGPAERSGPGTSLRPPTVTAPLGADVLAAAVQAEQEAWSRRMDVCLKLRQVGIDTNNDSLVRQADDLERQATVLYNARTAALGIPKVKPADTAPAALDRQFGTGVAVNPLTAPPAPAPVSGTAELKAPASPSPIREVKP